MAIYDLRSDTITKPTVSMLEAMYQATVGDDVFQEDPTINKLESKLASLFGMEAALFCLSGTMSNQIGIKAHTQPGNEIICEAEAHIYYYEAGGIASNSQCQTKTIKGIYGKITAEQVANAINPNDIHKAPTSLVCLENTCNRGGGSFYTIDEIKSIHQVCKQNQLAFHLDGARLWNAAIASNTPLSEYGKLFDSISVCFNKGLGCPVGSALLGTKAYIQKARKIRKSFGGGWRQAGYLAAAVLYALDHNYLRLATDHEHAKSIAKTLQTCNWVTNVAPVHTNIILFDVPENIGAAKAVETLKQYGIHCFPTDINRVRFVLHLHITSTDVDDINNQLKSISF